MSQVLAWAKAYAEQHSISALADLSKVYNRSTMSLYLNGKYPAGVEAIEDVLRPLMSVRLCPFLTREITAKDCESRHGRPKPHQQHGAMFEHWQACQHCEFNPIVTSAGDKK